MYGRDWTDLSQGRKGLDSTGKEWIRIGVELD